MPKINQEEYEKLAESEETEVKDIEWAKKEIEGLMTEESQNYPHDKMVEQEIVLGILNQLEVETLSPDWIDEHIDDADVRGSRQVFIHVEDLQNLLVPKQEEVTKEAHEKYGMSESRWAEVIERYKWHLEEEGYVVIEKPKISSKLANRIKELKERNSPIAPLMNDARFTNMNNEEDAIKAWLAYPNVEVEKEPKYVIKLDDESYLQRYEIDNKNVVSPFRIVGHFKEVAIKFDNRKKAKKVAELVEGEVEEVEE